MSNCELEEQADGEMFFLEDIKPVYPIEYDNMVVVWQREVRHHFPKDVISRMSDNRLLSARDFGLDDVQDVNSRHGQDFLNDVIPSIIKRVRSEGSGRKVKILDSGCGLGFTADQIRVRFGDQVRVFGTSLARGPRVAARKRAMIEQLRQESLFTMSACLGEPIAVSEEIRDSILASIGREIEVGDSERRMIHANDAKWRSILELSDYPEFDLIIDTYGELFYTNGVSYFHRDFRGNFRKVFCAALRKLMPGGVLCVASMKSDAQGRFIEKNCSEIEREYGVNIKYDPVKVDGIIFKRLVVQKMTAINSEYGV